MPINVLSRGREGRVFLKDTREDGVTVLLVCEVADDVVADALGATGVLYAPDPPQGGGGTFPMPKALIAPFELTVDTSDLLPSGVRRFRVGAFAEAASQLTSNGVREIRLDAESAKQFGLIENLAVAGEGEPVTV